jgi:hypothetical protein
MCGYVVKGCRERARGIESAVAWFIYSPAEQHESVEYVGLIYSPVTAAFDEIKQIPGEPGEQGPS